MRVKELYLKNFRCFEELTITFPTDYTVFIGNNGAGKSSILNALQIALDIFVNAIQYNKDEHSIINNSKLQHSDAMIKTEKIGSILNQESQYPTIIKTVAKIIDDKSISWEYTLEKDIIKIPHGIKTLIEYASNLQLKTMMHEKILLPIIAYYGTNRQWIELPTA